MKSPIWQPYQTENTLKKSRSAIKSYFVDLNRFLLTLNCFSLTLNRFSLTWSGQWSGQRKMIWSTIRSKKNDSRSKKNDSNRWPEVNDQVNDGVNDQVNGKWFEVNDRGKQSGKRSGQRSWQLKRFCRWPESLTSIQVNDGSLTLNLNRGQRFRSKKRSLNS